MVTSNVDQEPEDRRHQILAYIDQYCAENDSSPSTREILAYLKITGPADVHYHIECMEADGWITSLKTEKGHRKPGSIRLTYLGREQLRNHPSVEITVEQTGGEGGHAVKTPPHILEAGYVILSARLSNRKAVRTVNIPVLHLISASFGTEVFSSDFSLSGLGPENYLNINQDMLPARLKLEELFALEVRGDSMIEAGIQSGDYVILKRTQTADNGDMCAVWIDDREVTLKYFYREEKRVRLEPANSKMAPMFIGPSHKVEIQGKVVLVVRL